MHAHACVYVCIDSCNSGVIVVVCKASMHACMHVCFLMHVCMSVFVCMCIQLQFFGCIHVMAFGSVPIMLYVHVVFFQAKPISKKCKAIL